MPLASDLPFMRYALRLAMRGLGNVSPNPSVGAVLVKNNVVVGCAVTARGGRPHAETHAIEQAGEEAKDATLYVSLEPCSHHGKTRPCAEAVIKAGITRVVIACGDSNPLVAGKGIAMLQAAGITVEVGLCEAEAKALNAGFFSVIEHGRPYVALKMATSLDGKSATDSGESKWITGEAARMHGHLLRATHDAILTGIGTVVADDPALTCRLPGRSADSPQRIILDRNLRTPEQAKALPAWIFTLEKTVAARKSLVTALEKNGSRIFTVKEKDEKLLLSEVLSMLAKQGITRLLVEAGQAISSSFLAGGHVDRIYWFRAPLVIGDALTLSQLSRFKVAGLTRAGNDTLEIYECGNH